MSTNEMSPTLQLAMQLAEQGDKVEAENVLIQAVRDCESKFGKKSTEFAHANYELGGFLIFAGRAEDAIHPMRLAAAVNIPDDSFATRSRLTYLMQLGELYEEVEDFEEAEKVLRLGLKLRKQFYGEDHSGYAFGLEPLASVMMNRGQLLESLELVEQAIDIFWKDGHPRVTTAFPLRALILRRLNNPTPPFEPIRSLNAELLDEMVEATLYLSGRHEAADMQWVVHELLLELREKLGEDNQSTLKLQTGLANVASLIGPSEGRIETLEGLVKAHEKRGDQPTAIQAMLGLALAQSEAGNSQDSEATYRRAFKKAKALGDSSLQAKTLRNLGLLYVEDGKLKEGEKTLRMAVKSAKKSGDKSEFGQAVCALGIFLQHDDRHEDAVPFLEAAIRYLDDSHPNNTCARSHLTAIENGDDCGCGDMQDALADAFRDFLMSRLPEDWATDVHVEIGDTFHVEFEFLRELSEEETQKLESLVKQAMADFRNGQMEM